MRKWIENFGIIVFVSIVIFVILNVLVFYYIDNRYYAESNYEKFISPSSKKGLEIRKVIFQTKDESKLKQLIESPGMRRHTVLHFTEGLSKPYYTIGLEGIRYEDGWTDNFIKNRLRETYKHMYVFGGSTTFGDGVPNNMTLPAIMNSLFKELTVFNFGVQAHDHIRELEKLLYILQKGYRPKVVVFVDGLNDVTTFSWSNYKSFDKPRSQVYLQDRIDSDTYFGGPTVMTAFRVFANSLPIKKLLFRYLNTKPNTMKSISANTSPVNLENLRYSYDNWYKLNLGNELNIADQLVEYYKKTHEFIRLIGKIFGFTAYFVLQPIGFTDEENPFVIDMKNHSKYWEVFYKKIRLAIERKELNMIDCSRALIGIDGSKAYVDLTHYSDFGSNILSRCIKKNIIIYH